MTDNTEALRLANALENLEATGWGGDCFALTDYSEKQANLAAAELRRLHVLNAELLDAARQIRDMLNAPEFDYRDVFDMIEDAVKKAEGK